MALIDELANFNIVRVETRKWNSSKIGGKRGGSKGKQGSAKGYTTVRPSGHIQHTGCRSRRGEINPGLCCRHAGCRSSGSSPDTDGGAL
jgi:hypothetical protein